MDRRAFLSTIPALAVVASGSAVAASDDAYLAEIFGPRATPDEIAQFFSRHAAAVVIVADCSKVQTSLTGLRELLELDAGDIPQSVLDDLSRLPDELCGELIFAEPPLAIRADEHVVQLGFREGGVIDRVTAALRARRDGNNIGHGDLRVEG